MFVVTLNRARLRQIGVGAMCCAVVVCSALLGRYISTRTVEAAAGTAGQKAKIETAQDIQTWFTGYGIEVDGASITADKVKIPRKWDDSFSAFNTVVGQSGLDLERYKGKTVEKWQALIPSASSGEESCYGVLLVYKKKPVGAYLLMQLILTLYQWVMQFGYTAYALGLARRTGPGYRTLLDGFSQLGRALGVSFFTALFTSLWGLLAMVPYFVVLTVGAMAQSYALIMFSTVLALLAVVVEIAVSYRYRLATYFLLDDMNMGVLASIRESKQTMHGRKGALFVMDLSFLGWGLLSLITFGVVGLWASPYMWAAEANFYHWARWGTFPGEGPQPGGPQSGGYQSPYQKF